jgi:hypothetical protein
MPYISFRETGGFVDSKGERKEGRKEGRREERSL